mgnify:CR=1 FL=1
MLKHVLKEDVKKFPLIEFKGEITVVENKNDILKYCKIISKCSTIGFDTETKPAFQKGVSHNISLIQLSANNRIFLFRINKTGLDKNILNILTNPSILKVGIDLKNDLSGLKKITNFQECNFLDLNVLALQKGFKSIGAVKLTIMLLGCRISKRQRLSDWSADQLTSAQIEYAAIDAWICPKILQSFKSKLLFP